MKWRAIAERGITESCGGRSNNSESLEESGRVGGGEGANKRAGDRSSKYKIGY